LRRAPRGAYEAGMAPPLRFETFARGRAAPLIPALSRLRMAVFRDWPYLYDGSAAQEEEYLAPFIAGPSAALVVAFDGAEPVGCATCMALEEALDEVVAPFRAMGLDPEAHFYFGESVLLPQYRGRGAGVAFFAAREAHALAVSACAYATFCAVRRPDDHKLRPAGAGTLHGFWRNRGYAPVPGLACTMAWKQVDSAGEVTNTLDFWRRRIRP
jgi:GNAT superfamily N-acetyltransferase